MDAYTHTQQHFDAWPTPLIVTAADSRILHANPAALEVGLSEAFDREQIAAPPPATDLTTELLAEAARNGLAFARLVRPDGTVSEVFLRQFPVKFAGRSATATVAEDAGWILRTLRDAARERDLLSGVFATVGDQMLVLSAELTVLRASLAYCAAFGVAEADLQGLRLTQLHSGLWDRADLIQALSAIVPAENTLDSYRYEVEVAGQGCREFELTARKIYRAGNATRTVLLVVRDVTGVARRQEETLQRAKLDALGNLAGGLAHDINNRLQPIMTYAQLAAKSPDAEELPDWMRQIELNARKARNVVRNVLAFARRSPLQARLIDLSAAVTREVADLDQEMPATIRVVSEIARDVPAVEADTGEIEQIIDNLTSNARHAMASGGVLRIALAAVRVDQDHAQRESLAPGDYVRLSVADEGCGISEADLTRIFDPFFTTKEVGRGTGLGLSIVHGLVTARGGAIRVASQPDRGTRFDLYFPVVGTDGR